MIKQVIDQSIKNTRGLSLIHFKNEFQGFSHITVNQFQELDSYYNDYVNFYSINISENKELANELGLKTKSNIAFIKDGRVVDAIKGITTKSIISNKIQSHLKIQKRNFDYNLF